LPRAISIAHLATSMCFFSLTIVIALRTAPLLPTVPPEVTKLRRSIGVAWCAVLGQIVLGGLVRHTASGARLSRRAALQRIVVARPCA